MWKNPTALKRLGTLVMMMYAGGAFADSRLEARRHFRNGMSLIAQGKYDPGIAELLEAYAIKPHPNVLYNIARACQDAGRTQEAVDYYRRYLDASPADAARVQATLTGLEQSLEQGQASAKPPSPTAPNSPSAPSKPGMPPMPPPPAGGETARSLGALLERLEKAIARAEALPGASETPAPERGPPSEAGAAAAPALTTSVEEQGAVPYEERVVTASRRAQSSLEAPNATTVITADEIRQSGVTTVQDLLRRVPGAEVMAMGAGSANVSLRGFNQRLANKVLVLVDGRTEYQDFLGVTLWSTLPVELDDIERIEVIRGPGSALYGANAMLGVVNIITREPGTGPRARAQGYSGTGNTAGGHFTTHGGSGSLRYRASAGYAQADKWSRDFDNNRPDIILRDPQRDLGTRSARATLATTYLFNPTTELGVSGGVNRLYSELYPVGALRNFYVDGLTAFLKADANLGPVKVKTFWNTLSVDSAGPQYEARGQRSLVTRLDSNVFNAELLYSRNFTLLGEHQVNVGAEGRLKRVAWDYLTSLREELHAAVFIQDEWRIAQPFRVLASYRVDRHPLLDNGNPGLAHSPRVSALYMPAEGHALRASAATAFREPTFLESYSSVAFPVPGINGSSLLTQGSTMLRPERLVAFELGYRGEAPTLGIDWDVALYQNTVYDLIQLSAVDRSNAGNTWDGASGTYLLGRSFFSNERSRYIARGAEAGVTLAPVDGLGIKLSTALQRVTAEGEGSDELCGPCLQAPALKLYGSVTYRTRQNLELGLEAAWSTATQWLERDPSTTDPTRFDFTTNALPAYAVINARVGYTPVKDRVSVALLGTNLGPPHTEHPYGNRIQRRVLVLLTVTP